MASRVHGAMPGNIVARIPLPHLAGIIAHLGGTPGPERMELGEMERSMLQETANVAFSVLMNSLAQHLAVSAIPYASAIAIDLGNAAWDMLIAEVAEFGDDALVLSTRIAATGGGTEIELIFLPSPTALTAITACLADAESTSGMTTIPRSPPRVLPS
jgi:chemotaxis protein CheY-P-specific phosphatase CheC